MRKVVKLLVYDFENMKQFIKSTSEHPRLIASIPTDPVPLYKSNQRPGLKDAGHPPAA